MENEARESEPFPERKLVSNGSAGLYFVILVLFLISSGSGILLGLYYKPDVDEAYESVQDIVFAVPFGRLLRSLHYWAANSLIICIVAQIALMFFKRWHQDRGRHGWRADLCLAVLILMTAYTGMFLPFDQRGYWGTVIGANILRSGADVLTSLGSPPSLNPPLLLQGLLFNNNEIGDQTLARFSWLHFLVLPIFLGILLYARSKMIPRNTAIPSVPTTTTPSSRWPWLRLSPMLLFILASLLLLSYGFEKELATKANPQIPDNPIRAPWFFRPIQELVSHSSLIGGMILPVLIFIFLWMAPWIDQKKVARKLGRISFLSPFWGTLAFSILWCLFWLACSSFVASRQTLDSDFALLVAHFVAPLPVFAGVCLIWSAAVGFISSSRRSGFTALFTCLMACSVVMIYYVTYHRGPNWVFFLEPSGWEN